MSCCSETTLQPYRLKFLEVVKRLNVNELSFTDDEIVNAGVDTGRVIAITTPSGTRYIKLYTLA